MGLEISRNHNDIEKQVREFIELEKQLKHKEWDKNDSYVLLTLGDLYYFLKDKEYEKIIEDSNLFWKAFCYICSSDITIRPRSSITILREGYSPLYAPVHAFNGFFLEQKLKQNDFIIRIIDSSETLVFEIDQNSFNCFGKDLSRTRFANAVENSLYYLAQWFDATVTVFKEQDKKILYFNWNQMANKTVDPSWQKV